jgi:cytochrome c biogenesis protein CcmG, thiol:disulfide interchange protein DsbE
MSESAAPYTSPLPDEQEPESHAAPSAIRVSAIRTKVIPALALTLVVALLGLLAYSLFAPERARVTQGGRINEGGALVFDNGRIAPDFAGTTFTGDEFRLSDHRGQIVVLNFWASWCPPCREEMPLLVNADSLLGDDVVLVGVDIWDREGDARAFLNEYRVEYPNVQDQNGSIGIDYGVSGVPETFIIDAEGRIVVKLPGPVTSMQQLRDMVAEARR